MARLGDSLDRKHIPNREILAEIVRDVWIAWAKTQPNPKPSWLVSYHKLSEENKEADRQIGEAIARFSIAWAQSSQFKLDTSEDF